MPLLFLIFIDDIVTDIGANIRLFADDPSLYIIVEHPDTAALCLNNDLQTIPVWAHKWMVTFNPLKTEFLTISRKLNKPYHSPLYMCPKAALLFWFFGGFRCGVPLFIVMLVIY